MKNKNTTEAIVDVRVEGIRHTVKQKIIDMKSQLTEMMEDEIDQKLTTEYLEAFIKEKVDKQLEQKLDQAVEHALDRITQEVASGIVGEINDWGIYETLMDTARDRVIETLEGYKGDK